VERATYDSKGNILERNFTRCYGIQRCNKFLITMEEIQNVFNSSMTNKYFKNQDLAYDNQINEDEEDVAEKIGSYLFFGDGSSYEYKNARTTSKSNYHTHTFQGSLHVAIKVGFEFSISVGYGFIKVGHNEKRQNIKYHDISRNEIRSWESEHADEETMGFVFSDETSKDPADRYQFDCYVDKRYQTLCFINDNISSFSSEPWEHYTRDNHNPTITDICLVDENDNELEEPYIAGNMTRIRVGAMDDESGIDRVVLFKGQPGGSEDAIDIIWTPDSDGYYYYNWDTENESEGNLNIFARTFDKYENNFTTSIIQVNIDHSPPNYVAVLPFATPQLPGDIECKAIVYDNTIVDHVIYYDGDPDINGEPLKPNNGTSYDSENCWSYHWTTTKEDDEGEHKIYIVAYDKVGNSYKGGPAVIYIGDPIAPSKCEIISPSDYEAKNSNFTIKAEVEDELSGVDLVKFFDGDPTNSSNLIGSQSRDLFHPPLTECELECDIDDFNEGLHEIYVVAYDNYSKNKTDMIHLYIDKTAPNSFNFTYGHHNNYSVEFWAKDLSDGLSGIAKVEYYKGTGKIGEGVQPDQFQFLWFGPNGTHDIWARAYDQAGNYVDSNNNETVIIIYGTEKGEDPIIIIPKLNDTGWLLGSQIALIIGSIGGILAILFIKKRRKNQKTSKMLKIYQKNKKC
ncbi:MAG: hypothetical protein HWN67_19790, partial [Candidatus Helarchaeota archaeon]|nr:hypothetical protein [Candidatus Helarchaeota archaeon]